MPDEIDFNWERERRIRVDERIESKFPTVDQVPTADIIWVVDDSDSMIGDREDVVANAKDLFSRATAGGLDFPMCVTGVCAPGLAADCPQEIVGTCCSSVDGLPCCSSGPDRFLLPGCSPPAWRTRRADSNTSASQQPGTRSPSAR